MTKLTHEEAERFCNLVDALVRSNVEPRLSADEFEDDIRALVDRYGERLSAETMISAVERVLDEEDGK